MCKRPPVRRHFFLRKFGACRGAARVNLSDLSCRLVGISLMRIALTTQTQTFNEVLVTLFAFTLDIGQQAATLVDHQQKTTT